MTDTQEQPLRYQVRIAAGPERVWAALTTSEGTRATLYGCSIDSTFEIGARVEFFGHDADGQRVVQVYGEVTAFEPGRCFGYRQHPGPAHNERHAETHCRMTHTLTPVDGGTELELVVDEWTPGNPAYQHAKASYPESGYLDGIKKYAEA
ncbi:SRPBCC domain-containing protein [Kitasatospora sp. NPDC002227]|uniref:SRPBCC domain-containing protein n=1 Tax=Kitasatospora sp. NPDC002227 TaxID=3154773 RepID=UPI00332941B0